MFFSAASDTYAQSSNRGHIYHHTSLQQYALTPGGYEFNRLHPEYRFSANLTAISVRDTVPDPRNVMRQSMMLPGRGQITNNQTWKVPVIYSLFAGVIVYSVYSDSRYRGYRAAYYNSFTENTDQRFGPTPSYIPQGLPSEQYRFNRNSFRNRRDLSFVGLLLVYGLNIADAYIFAHLRDFDVSDDLSSVIQIAPDYFQETPYLAVGVNFSF
jgi:hypothetical protein